MIWAVEMKCRICVMFYAAVAIQNRESDRSEHVLRRCLLLNELVGLYLKE